MKRKPLVGISKCLLGENVRYDGKNKLDLYLRDTLGKHVKYIPICPEVESGMSIPREAIKLVEIKGKICLITEETNNDITEQMDSWIKKQIEHLSNKNLCGFIFKSKSPSCGLSDAEVSRKNAITKDGTGLFARAFVESFPFIPVIDEKQINSPKIKKSFIEQIFLVNRWNILKGKLKSLKNLIYFHTSHKYFIMAHSPNGLKKLGELLGNQKEYSLDELYEKYYELLIKCIQKPATVEKNTNVLMHLMGYFKKYLTRSEKKELKNLIERYHSVSIPLITPVTMINHYVKKYDNEYLKKQVYLNLTLAESILRNHV